MPTDDDRANWPIEAIAGATGVTRALDRMYGGASGPAPAGICSAPGVVHVAAVWAERPDRHITLRIQADSPKSAHDFFALNVARARADAIVTSGKILRDEPDLVHDLQGPGSAAIGLASWRREVLGKRRPPYLLILTSGRQIPTDRPLAGWHPAFRGWAEPIVYTTEAAARTLADRDSRTRVVGDPAPSIHRAIDHLQRELGCRTIALEAGPTTTRALYDDPTRPVVDELMLSVFEGERIPDRVRGEPFAPPSRIRAILPRSSPPYRVAEPSGPWRYQRFTRE